MSGAANCPECGARVSSFAAGCAVCGADLEAHHRRARLAALEAPPSRARRLPPLSELPRPSLSRLEAIYLAVTVFFVAYVSALGLVLAVLGAMHGFYEGRRWLLAVFALLAVLALAIELT
jgi:hypothetical protein